MTALSAGHDPDTWVSPWPSNAYQKIIANAAVIYRNAVVAKNASGLFVPISADPTLVAFGFARLADADSVTGNGTKEIIVDTGCKLLAASGLAQANEGDVVYAVDDQTVSLSSNSGARPVVGVLEKFVSATSGFVSVHPMQSRILAAEVSAKSSKAPILLSLYDFREVDSNSDVGAITANGGILASDTTPILRGDAAETQEIAWAATNVDPIALQTALPPDFDGTGDVTVDLWVKSGGTTNVASFTVETGWDGGALVSDTATDAAASTTLRKITATIAAADVPDSASLLTLILTPAAHATDTINLFGVRVNYQRKLLAS